MSTTMSYADKLKKETQVFSGKHNDVVRAIAWSAIPYFQTKLRERLEVVKQAKDQLAGRSTRSALTIACGDMKGEYPFLKALGATEITAYDLSEGQRDRCLRQVYDGKVPLTYEIGDANELQLEHNKYDIVYMQQSLHHLTEIDQVLGRIAKSMTPGAVFVLNDYVGEPFLQRGPKQRIVCQQIWNELPARLRTDRLGVVHDKLFIPVKEKLSPFEAIKSDLILPCLRTHFDTVAEDLFGGVIFPVVNNFAFNYKIGTEEDDKLIEYLWLLDETLGAMNIVEPTFVRGVYTAKQ